LAVFFARFTVRLTLRLTARVDRAAFFATPAAVLFAVEIADDAAAAAESAAPDTVVTAAPAVSETTRAALPSELPTYSAVRDSVSSVELEPPTT
jgi:hypothetical protein